MLIINQQEIEKAASPIELVNAIEKAYAIQHKDSTHIPDRMHIENKGNTLLLMPGFTESTFGTKLVSVFPKNAKNNQQVLHGLMILNDSNTGEPIALINGSKLTAMRTGAVGATTIKHIVPPTAQTLGIIGAGVQAYHQAIMACALQPFKTLIICDKSPINTDNLKQQLDGKINTPNTIVTRNPDQLVLDSDVIITATSSNKPVFDIKNNNLDNKTFIGIGSYKPDMQEFPLTLFEALDKVYVDTPFAKQESGDIKIPLDKGLIKEVDIIPFSSFLSNMAAINKSSCILFKSVGMALFDLTVAELIYKNAKEKGLGVDVEI